MKLTSAVVIAFVSSAAIKGRTSSCANIGQESNMPQGCANIGQESYMPQGCTGGQRSSQQNARFPNLDTEFIGPQSRQQFRPSQQQQFNLDPQQIVVTAQYLNEKLDKLQEFIKFGYSMEGKFKQEFGDLAENIQEMRQNLNQITSLNQQTSRMGSQGLGQMNQQRIDMTQNIGQLTDQEQQQLKDFQQQFRSSQPEIDLSSIGNIDVEKAMTCAKSLSSKLGKLQQFLQTAEGLKEKFQDKFSNIQQIIQETQMDLSQIESLQSPGQKSLYKRYWDVDVDADWDRGFIGDDDDRFDNDIDLNVAGTGYHGYYGGYRRYPYRNYRWNRYRYWNRGWPRYGGWHRGWHGHGHF